MKLEMVKEYLPFLERAKEITGLVFALAGAECLIYTQDEVEIIRKTSGSTEQEQL